MQLTNFFEIEITEYSKIMKISTKYQCYSDDDGFFLFVLFEAKETSDTPNHFFSRSFVVKLSPTIGPAFTKLILNPLYNPRIPSRARTLLEKSLLLSSTSKLMYLSLLFHSQASSTLTLTHFSLSSLVKYIPKEKGDMLYLFLFLP